MKRCFSFLVLVSFASGLLQSCNQAEPKDANAKATLEREKALIEKEQALLDREKELMQKEGETKSSESKPLTKPKVKNVVKQGDFYIISVGAVKTEEQARAEVQKLSRRGFEANYLWIPDYPSLSGKPYFSVYLGPYDNQDACEYAVDDAKSEFPGAYGVLVSQRPTRVQITGIGQVSVTKN